MNDRTYKRVLKELIDANLLHFISKKEQTYYVNPFVFSNSGNIELVQQSKMFFVENNIFYSLELDDNIRSG
ncbi:MAG: hypothetical protein NC253_12820 [Ruminococcus sp.]|nr:hypothetical protein [Ruminococcus sp.]MCM1382402.1 hypothetical protein [Muribaculaceae bacterium]MCM1479688.1 hypothetical protein [Muribaculaceae bacterium]